MTLKTISIIISCLFTFRAMAQQNITGTVTDETGTPLIAASVAIESTTKGTSTDAVGKYTIAKLVEASPKLAKRSGDSGHQ